MRKSNSLTAHPLLGGARGGSRLIAYGGDEPTQASSEEIAIFYSYPDSKEILYLLAPALAPLRSDGQYDSIPG
ncbi:MAG: hypothetical protein WKF70_04515, partial [Chitinophagaceae bacterium]